VLASVSGRGVIGKNFNALPFFLILLLVRYYAKIYNRVLILFSMGFFNLFKKKKKEIVENEVILWEKFPVWLENKKKEIENRENQIFEESREIIKNFVENLDSQINVLQETDLSDRKVEKRVRNIVEENLKNYIIHLRDLEKELQKINNGKKFIKKINNIFTNFENKSRVNFAKASFLVREETNNAKKLLKNFLKEIEDVVKNNKEIIHEKTINSIDEKYFEYNNIKNGKEQILKAIREDNIKIDNLKENIKNRNKKLEEIKNSKEYIENKKKEEEKIQKRKKLENEIENLKEFVDFKSLANFYHSFEREMNLVKECKENFKQIFKRSKENNFLTLLEGANLLDEKIMTKIKEIDELKKEIEEISIIDLGSEKIENEIKDMENEINSVFSEMNSKKKKVNQMNEELENLKNEIISKMEEIEVLVKE
jgi:hypothetical protein